MDILIYVLIFWAGIIVGFFIRALFTYKDVAIGTIHVIRDREKTVYSLELENYPEELRFKKEVIFKVDSSEIAEIIDTPE